MVFDFAAQPPELISAKIYAGPGSESLQAAAAAWDGLSSELQSTAANFQSVITGPGQRRLDRPVVRGRRRGRRAVRVVAVDDGGPGRADRKSGPGRGQCLRDARWRPPCRRPRSPPTALSCCRCCRPTSSGSTTRRSRPSRPSTPSSGPRTSPPLTGYAGSSQAATTGLGSFTEAPQTTNSSGQATQAAATTAASAAAAPTDLESILEQAEATATNFLNQVTTLNGDYTKFFTNALGTMPGGSTLATTWTNMYSFISGAGSQATWTNVVNSTHRYGHLAVEELLHLPALEPRDRSGFAERWSVLAGGHPGPAWERGRRRRLWAARRRWANCRCRPAGPVPPRRSGSPLRRCRTALLPRRQLRRWRSR